MKVYHGSLERICVPEIRKPNRTLDYGAGFYTTTDFDQAKHWVERHKNEDVQLGYVNVYEVDDAKLKEAKVLWFDKPTESWVDFVYSNRNDKSFCHNYDFVYGPVANDRVYAAFALYESGILDKKDLIRELKTYKLVDQLLFHTNKALTLLHYIEGGFYKFNVNMKYFENILFCDFGRFWSSCCLSLGHVARYTPSFRSAICSKTNSKSQEINL